MGILRDDFAFLTPNDLDELADAIVFDVSLMKHIKQYLSIIGIVPTDIYIYIYILYMCV